MSYQTNFKRYELKYLLTRRQREALLSAMEPYMSLDGYGRTTIRNLYFDTDTYRLIRRSLEKPRYKEKLRVRSYSRAGFCDDVFVELKKKYKSVVYKRRVSLPLNQTLACFSNGLPLPLHTQISKEIDYFRSYYETLRPKVFLSYEREAYFPLGGGDFRVTFDDSILYRTSELTLDSEAYGTPILDADSSLMEIKTSGGIPLWMSHALNEQSAFTTSFSKYGYAYENMRGSLKIGGLLYA